MITSGFFNSDPSSADRVYDANSFNMIMRGTFSNGRMAGYGDTSGQFIVSNTSNPYEISVTPGAYLFNGLWLVSTENETIKIDSSLGAALALVLRHSVVARSLYFDVIAQSEIILSSDAVIAYFAKAGDGAISITRQFWDVSTVVNSPHYVTLIASGWQGDLYTLPIADVIENGNLMDVWPELDNAADSNQRDAWEAGLIWTKSQADGSVTLGAWNTVPAIDLPVILRMRRYTL